MQFLLHGEGGVAGVGRQLFDHAVVVLHPGLDGGQVGAREHFLGVPRVQDAAQVGEARRDVHDGCADHGLRRAELGDVCS